MDPSSCRHNLVVSVFIVVGQTFQHIFRQNNKIQYRQIPFASRNQCDIDNVATCTAGPILLLPVNLILHAAIVLHPNSDFNSIFNLEFILNPYSSPNYTVNQIEHPNSTKHYLYLTSNDLKFANFTKITVLKYIFSKENQIYIFWYLVFVCSCSQLLDWRHPSVSGNFLLTYSRFFKIFKAILKSNLSDFGHRRFSLGGMSDETVTETGLDCNNRINQFENRTKLD